MSAARILAGICNHWSPSPSSEVALRVTSRSTTRTVSTATPSGLWVVEGRGVRWGQRSTRPGSAAGPVLIVVAGGR